MMCWTIVHSLTCANDAIVRRVRLIDRFMTLTLGQDMHDEGIARLLPIMRELPLAPASVRPDPRLIAQTAGGIVPI